MIRVVIDTNVLVSALWSGGGNPANIVKLVSTVITPVFTEDIFLEYVDVLNRPRFKFSTGKTNGLLLGLRKYGEIIEVVEKSLIPMVDETDRIFYDTARTSGAILVTGNRRHFPDESFIMTPSQFLQILKK